MGFPLGSYGVSHHVSMIFLEDFYGISEEMLWEFNGILMEFLLGSYEISMMYLWDFFGIPMVSYGIPMGAP